MEQYLYESVTDFLMDNVTVVFPNGTHEMSNIHHIPKETGFMGIKSFCTCGSSLSFQGTWQYTVTTSTQYGPVEDHSWSNGAPVPYCVFNGCTHEVITAIDVLGNSSIANTNNTINFNEYINEFISINVTYQRSMHLLPFVCAVVNV